MEGILEKPSRIPGKKTKVWSVLDDTTLSFFREHKRSSCIDSVELSDIQSVRKVTENQFEIVTDINSQIYTAVSEEECKQWVERLSKFSKGAEDSKQSVAKSNKIIDIAKDEGEHTVEVKSARNIFESTPTEKQNTGPKRPLSTTLIRKDGSEHTVGVKTTRNIFETQNKKASKAEKILISTSSVIENSKVGQTLEQKSPKISLSENVLTTISTPEFLPESSPNNQPEEKIDGKPVNDVLETQQTGNALTNCETAVTSTATDVNTKLEQPLEVQISNAIFETQFIKDETTKFRRPVSNLSQEHEKKRKSDPKKSHSWSTITDVRSHLNHVSVSDETLKSSRTLPVSVSTQENLKTSDSLNPELEQARNKLKRISNINVRQDKSESMKNKGETVQDSSEADGLLNTSMNATSAVTVCEIDKELDNNKTQENDQLDASTGNCLEKTILAGNTVNEYGTGENRPDSGYSTTVCENGQNSQDNKMDINTTGKTDEATTDISKNTYSEPEQEEKKAVTDETSTLTESQNFTDKEDENKEKEETIVLMRKSNRSVSVSRRGDVSLVADENELELQTTNTAFTFPNVRRSTKSSNTFDNEDKQNKTTLSHTSLGNLKTDDAENKYQPRDSTEDDEKHLSSFGQDKVDGEISYTSAEHELVDNYIDIDSIMNKVKFPNIPTLPNKGPNCADLLSFHELKESLGYCDSEDDHSDEEVIVREDSIQRLSRLVDM